MGYRSTIVSQDYDGNELPKWFTEKYYGWVYTRTNSFFYKMISRFLPIDSNFRTKYLHKIHPSTLVSSNRECKYYHEQFFKDYQKALDEINFLEGEYFKNNSFVVVMLGEDGYVTKVEIKKDSIRYFQMDKSMEMDGVNTFKS